MFNRQTIFKCNKLTEEKKTQKKRVVFAHERKSKNEMKNEVILCAQNPTMHLAAKLHMSIHLYK